MFCYATSRSYDKGEHLLLEQPNKRLLIDLEKRKLEIYDNDFIVGVNTLLQGIEKIVFTPEEIVVVLSE